MKQRLSIPALWLMYIGGYIVVVIGIPLLTAWAIGDSMCWKEPLVGAITATLVVLYSYVAAPRYGYYTAGIGFLLGLFLAFHTPGMHWYPECHAEAYNPTKAAFVITSLCGLAALLTVFLWAYKKRG